MENTTDTQEQDITLTQSEHSLDQKIVPLSSQEEVKDTDLVMIQNDTPLTTSRTVAEQFDKNHRDVLRDIRDLCSQVGDERKIAPMFHETTYADKYGRQKPMYTMTRDGFSLLAMGFTGKKALEFKLKFIDAFNRMEEELKRQKDKSMSLAQQLAVQAQLNLQFEEQLNEQAARLNQHTQQLQQQSADIKRLQQAHNGMSLRHEMRDNEQQEQLDRHEADITDLQKNMYELLTEKADISQDMDIFISTVVNIYYQHIKDQTDQYKTAWKDFYNAIAEEAGRPKGYIQSLKTRQRNTLMNSGIARTTAEKRVTGKTVVNSNQDLKTAAIAVMARISEDINAHKEEEEQSL